MILVDTNVLLYARASNFPQHRRAQEWLDTKLAGRDGVGLPWQALLGFLRISTNARLFPRPLSMEEAWAQVHEWLAQPPVWCPGETDAHTEVLSRLVVDRGLNGKLVMDAHLAAIAIEHGLVLCSADDDFRRFDGLHFENPLHP